MSFSTDLKEELSKINNLAKKDLVKMELLGYLISSNVSIANNEIKFSTESDYNINRFANLLENMRIMNYSIGVSGKTYYITFDINDIYEIANIENNQIILDYIPEKEDMTKALIRGIYLGSGSVNNPENKYHLEISLLNNENTKKINNMLINCGINSKILKNSKDYTIYFKEGEEISKFLAFINANKSVLKFEEIRVQRDMNNKVNRLVNCETANLNKTINAAVEQIEAIEKLKRNNKFESLDDNLKEIANARIENPNMSLIEIGKLLSVPVGKSGANYRLKKIIEIANEL